MSIYNAQWQYFNSNFTAQISAKPGEDLILNTAGEELVLDTANLYQFTVEFV